MADTISILDRTRELVAVPNSKPYQDLRDALQDGAFRQEAGILWPVAELVRSGGRAMMVPAHMDPNALLPPEQMEAAVNLMWEQRQAMSDRDADTLDMLSVMWLKRASGPESTVRVRVSELLELRGLSRRQRNGRSKGYRERQRKAELAAVQRILSLWVTVAKLDVYDRRGKKSTEAAQSRAWAVTDRAGQLHLNGVDMDVREIWGKPGELFSQFLFGKGRQIALMSVRALQYDSRRQRPEKRITRFLAWGWRIRKTPKRMMESFHVSKLLEAAGLKPNLHHPSRTLDRLERALDTLNADGVIASWKYLEWDGIQYRQDWLPEWLSASISVEPPGEVMDAYRQIADANPPRQKALPAGSITGQAIAEVRTERGLSQAELARELGIKQQRLSRIEAGRAARIDSGLDRRIRAWFGEAE